jgi:hypothetical protein
MSFLDRLLGRQPAPPPQPPRQARPSEDELAVERYRYLLRTAPPDKLEEAHREAFERLTPEQRATIQQQLAQAVPDEAPASTDPQELARSATRAELRRPGTMEQTLGRQGAMPGMAGNFLSTFAAVVVGTTVAQALFGGFGGVGDGTEQGADGAAEGEPGEDPAELDPWDPSADAGEPGGEMTGDVGDFGDFGGGDFGGGDFGGDF